MAWVDRPYFLLRPSRLLGFLLLGLVVSTALLVYWIKSEATLPVLNIPAPKWRLGNLVTVVVAIMVWIGTSYVTMRNLVKQHTINTLLQSRLSATYMENARALNKGFFGKHGELIPLTQEEVINPPAEVNLQALNYMLNYFEFIAVGIRHGDLDESVMKNSLRGIVCSVFCVAENYIHTRRSDVRDPSKARTYEHLCWLHARWRDDSQLPPRKLRETAEPKILGMPERIAILLTGKIPENKR
ncbi:DUF4760 domain-containing protein [Acidovorax facilis]|jgi:hypothetical protein|uniref:DUF4760 domain-containing protein n=1 Tax=Acidovorax facilis TaxID=12917 RepID=UPI003D661A81